MCMIVYFQATTAPGDKAKHNTLMDTLAWFFFKLLVFGYVEDLETGMAFQLPGGLHRKIFVEVSCFYVECCIMHQRLYYTIMVVIAQSIIVQ